MRSSLALPLACLVTSGMAGLVAEVAWSRALAALFGSALTATGLLLAIFMGGLGLGSAIGGRVARRAGNPLAAFGAVEIVIGSLILATPAFFDMIAPAVKRLDVRLPDALAPAVPATLSLPILGTIVVLMGTTFPLFLTFAARSRATVGRASGLVYGVNTFGAVAGTLLAGFWLLPSFGIANGIRVAAALDLCAGTAALALAFRSSRTHDAVSSLVPDDEYARTSRASISTPVSIAFLGGFAALALEVAWFRALMLVFGSSVYAISLMLAAFLCGLSGGAVVIARRSDAQTDVRSLLGRVHWQIAFSSTLVTFLVQLVPVAYIAILESTGGAFAGVASSSFVVIAILLAVPTLLMGAALPLAIRLAVEDRREHASREAGTVYAASSLGSCTGALAAGFVLVPAAGVRGTVAAAAVASLCAATLALRGSSDRAARKLALQAGALIVALWGAWLGNLLPWDWRVLTGGYYAYAHLYTKNRATAIGPLRREVVLDVDPPFASGSSPAQFPEATAEGNESLLFWRDGMLAQVAVVQNGPVRSLLLNGKADASNARGDMRTQLLLGHLPALLAPSAPAGEAMVIGLGSGVTAGAVASWPYERVIAAEIEPMVAKAAGFFASENQSALDNPRVTLRIDDARRILDRSPGGLRLITSEPSNLWMSGVSLLFTREFFELAASKLDDRGVFCQWLHLYQVGDSDVKTLLASMGGSFPYMIVFVDETDLLIVASKSSLQLDPAAWNARLAANRVAGSMLAGAGIGSPRDIAAGIVADERAVRTWSAGAELHTDDRPILEFTAARQMGFDRSAPIVSALVQAGVETGVIKLGQHGSVGGYAGSAAPREED
ncbi:MAG: fused MFS/spermidine synthase [Acidobacteria bacterium]|nr:fused MFS/spermidine synthase [Acidobacteriota bacterium]